MHGHAPRLPKGDPRPGASVAALEAALAHLDKEEAPVRRRLIWVDDPGFGFYPVDQSEAPYDSEYFAKYEGYAKTAAPPYLHGHAQEPGVFADVAAQMLKFGIERTQQVLETGDVVTRLETILGWMKEGPPSA